jgi:hypothetical protein
MSPRFLKRRDFAVTQAGYFTVLKPTGGFSATLPPGSLQDLVGQPKKPAVITAPDQKAVDHAVGAETTIHLQTVTQSAGELHWIRLALIVLTAAALTLSVLWWMTPDNPWHDLGR